VSGSVFQAANVQTVDAHTHILIRLMRFGQTNNFIQRYGDTGSDEFEARGGTIPQRLLLMNGELVRERIQVNPLNATSQIAWMARDDRKLLDTAFLAVLSRRPTPDEAAHFAERLTDHSLDRPHRVEDLFWSLINTTEFSWNH
jgi:hypothetical protein